MFKKTQPELHHQGGVVPIQSMLTLEDAVNNQAANETHEESNTEGDDGQFDPADYTDHLYDSDGRSSQQSQQNTFRIASENTYSTFLRSSAPVYPSRPNINLFSTTAQENSTSKFDSAYQSSFP